MRINNSLMALNTYNNLGSTKRQKMTKLSSGLRINYAGDDATGLIISEKMREEIRGIDRLSRKEQETVIQEFEATLSNSSTVYELINNFYEKIQKNHPVLLETIKTLIIPIVIVVVTSVVQDNAEFDKNIYVQENNYYQTNYSYEYSKTTINMAIVFKQCRSVKKNYTKVFIAMNTKSNTCGILNKGSIVRLVERNKKWSLIEFFNGDKIVKGYVLNKYLKKTKK